MKLKLTVSFKNGSCLKVVKAMSDPPKGTDINTHYMLEADELTRCIRENGLHLSISPAQIDEIFVQPRPEKKNGINRKSQKIGSALQRAEL